MSKVVYIEKQHPETALENLNRLTGLDFQSWPESLLDEDNLVEPASSSAPDARLTRDPRTAPEHDQRAAGCDRYAGGTRRANRR